MPIKRLRAVFSYVLPLCLLPFGAVAQERLALLWDAGADAVRLEAALEEAGYEVRVLAPPGSGLAPDPEEAAEAVITLAPVEEKDANLIALTSLPETDDAAEPAFVADATAEEEIDVPEDSAAPRAALRPPGKGQVAEAAPTEETEPAEVATPETPPEPEQTPLERFAYDAASAGIVLIYARLDPEDEPSLEGMISLAETARRASVVFARICADAEVEPERDIAARGVGPVVLQMLGCEEGAEETEEANPLASAVIAMLEKQGLEAGPALAQLEASLPQIAQAGGALPDMPIFLSSREGESPTNSRDPRDAWASLDVDAFAPVVERAEEGDPRALLGRAYTHLAPADVRYDPKAAAGDLRAAADAGSAAAAYELGRLFETGLGVAKDTDGAVALYEQAAQGGHAAAANDLGFLHMEGELGVPAEPGSAQRYFRQAADLGHPQAMFNVATMIGEGAVASTDPEDAAAYVYRGLRRGAGTIFDLVREDPRILRRPVRLALQRLLAADGLYDGEIDGAVGPQTKQAIRLAQGLEE